MSKYVFAFDKRLFVFRINLPTARIFIAACIGELTLGINNDNAIVCTQSNKKVSLRIPYQQFIAHSCVYIKMFD